MDWFFFTLFTTGVAGIIVQPFWEDDSKSINKSIEYGRIFAAIAFWGGSQFAFNNYDSKAEVIGAILVGTLPLSIIAFFVGYILGKVKDKHGE
jgi:hypothetical protein